MQRRGAVPVMWMVVAGGLFVLVTGLMFMATSGNILHFSGIGDNQANSAEQQRCVKTICDFCYEGENSAGASQWKTGSWTTAVPSCAEFSEDFGSEECGDITDMCDVGQ